jgi:hypothetical protein
VTTSGDEQNSGETSPRIRRGRIDSFALYEISEQELDVLEKGSPSALQLNFSIALLSVAASFLVTVLSQPLEGKIFLVFVVVVSVGTALGAYLMFVWARNRTSVSSTIRRIRGRLPGDREQAE